MTQVGQLIFKDGWEAGLVKGEENGKTAGGLLKLIEQVQKKYRKGKTLAVISEEVEASETEIRPILDCVKQYPEADKEKILEYLKEQSRQS